MGWLITAFDLPVVSDEARKDYIKFRKFLLKDGYQMIQYSVYARPMVTYSRLKTHVRRVCKEIPREGNIRIWYLTQSQWERSIVLHGKPAKKTAPESIPEQLCFW